MQLSTLAVFGLTTLAAAVPVNERDAKRSAAPAYCCPKGKVSKCSPCGPKETCPAGSDKYSVCSNNAILGLINIVVCDVLNDVSVAVPINIDIL